MIKVENKRRYHLGCTNLMTRTDIDWLEEDGELQCR